MQSLGKVDAVYIVDDYALGKDSGLIDAVVVGNIDRSRLDELRRIVEKKISRKVRVMDLTPEEFANSSNVFLSRPHWKVV
jgi:hypothetical protein